MQLTRLLSAAALAWTASAMLVTPHAEVHSEEGSYTALELVAMNPDASIVRLPCDGCAVAQDSWKEGRRTWDVSGNKMTDLVLVLMKDGKSVFLGGSPIYGPLKAKDVPLTRQVPALITQEHFQVSRDDLPMAIHAEVSPKRPVAGQANTFATDFKIEVLGIEDKVVHVPSVAFTVFDNGKEIILSEAAIVPTFTTLADARCQTIICRVKAQLAAKIMALKEAMKSTASKAKTGCMRMMGMHPHGKHGHHGHKHGKQQQQESGAAVNIVDRLHGGPNKFKGHHGMRKPCGRHGFIGRLAHGAVYFTRHFVVPILIGVAAGMAVGALAMVVGQLTCMIWMRLTGRRQAGYVVLHQVEQTEDIEQAEEQLPKYEPSDKAFPPAYDSEKA